MTNARTWRYGETIPSQKEERRRTELYIYGCVMLTDMATASIENIESFDCEKSGDDAVRTSLVRIINDPMGGV